MSHLRWFIDNKIVIWSGAARVTAKQCIGEKSGKIAAERALWQLCNNGPKNWDKATKITYCLEVAPLGVFNFWKRHFGVCDCVRLKKAYSEYSVGIFPQHQLCTIYYPERRAHATKNWQRRECELNSIAPIFQYVVYSITGRRLAYL